MEQISGLGKTDRERLSAVLRGDKGMISVAEAATILETSETTAAKMLPPWATKGWLSRVRLGLHLPVPLESRTADVPLEDPRLIARRLFNPCYTGGNEAVDVDEIMTFYGPCATRGEWMI